MRYVLLTWNPGPDDSDQYTPQEWLERMVLPLQLGQQPDGDRWSIGTNWRAIAKGDLVCMLRQGSHGRGIVATGVITRGPFLAPHWDSTRTGKAHYVNVAWGRAMPINEMITVAELEARVPGFAWGQIYSSGRIVEGEAGAALAELLGQGPPRGRGAKKGQQFGTVEHNRLVELEAMRVVTRDYESSDWTVEDVSAKKLGWDIEAHRGGARLYVEVKGVTGPDPAFFLTANEHRAAAEQAGWITVVVTGVFGPKVSLSTLTAANVLNAARPTQYRVTP
ncbi:DUF3883 domain-containing protein [Phycicoccus sonneratiae]|uniref:DUF3883 domain-containing protein n=1 Tax=Phycicoccus sonneratiae TaxID=2807628 RepID=A0ABS2CL42_9MICO|nr:DUF3883 domain-containing protein [Phycicoccus sonneraticus]MBM6399789.1 DUF3883 domain-containing protein [Phycicoccus sonneraticus]